MYEVGHVDCIGYQVVDITATLYLLGFGNVNRSI